MSHRFTAQVYYEDTDMAGIVYYANYLKYIERARSDWVAKRGIDQRALRQKDIVFAVQKLEAQYHRPAYLGDLLEIRTSVDTRTSARLRLGQNIWRDQTLIFTSTVTLVAMNMQGKPQRLPAELC